MHEQERELYKAAANTLIFEEEEAEKVKLAKLQVMMESQKNAELKQLRFDMVNNTQRQIAQLQQVSEVEKRQLEALSQAKLNEMKQAAEMEKQRLIDLAKQEISMTASLKDQQTALIQQSRIELELSSNQDKETIAVMERQMQKNAEIMRMTMQIEFNTKTAEMRQVNKAQQIEFQRVQAENQQAQSKMNTLVFELQAQLTAQAAQNTQLQLGPSQAHLENMLNDRMKQVNDKHSKEIEDIRSSILQAKIEKDKIHMKERDIMQKELTQWRTQCDSLTEHIQEQTAKENKRASSQPPLIREENKEEP